MWRAIMSLPINVKTIVTHFVKLALLCSLHLIGNVIQINKYIKIIIPNAYFHYLTHNCSHIY